MKQYTLFLLISLLSLPLLSQIVQKGKARELNSNKTPLGEVFIKFEDAVSTESDDGGNFRLAFADKKAGDLIFLEDIHRQGYELVNRKDFEVTKIGNTEQLKLDIILAKAGVVDAAKKEYYGVSDKALLAGFTQEKQALRNQLKAAALSQEQYVDELSVLQEQYDLQRESLDALAEKFARINFDDVGPVYKEALTLFKEGRIKEAITTLENSNPTQRTAAILKERKRIGDARTILAIQEDSLAIEIEKQIAAIRLLADMYSLNFDPDKAEQ